LCWGWRGSSSAIFTRDLPLSTVTEESPVTKLPAPRKITGSCAELQQQPIKSQSEKHYTRTHKNHAKHFTIAISFIPQDNPVRWVTSPHVTEEEIED